MWYDDILNLFNGHMHQGGGGQLPQEMFKT